MALETRVKKKSKNESFLKNLGTFILRQKRVVLEKKQTYSFLWPNN